ncbi:hypothetical protein GCM10020366_16280 [Saccharopolyspora gregorii]|uniref:Uncharacterized protein n=1 Tax=Saccharopolyspora gregorii TaxID=33914 RepID=A0ABP6RGW3_9PSEU
MWAGSGDPAHLRRKKGGGIPGAGGGREERDPDGWGWEGTGEGESGVARTRGGATPDSRVRPRARRKIRFA